MLLSKCCFAKQFYDTDPIGHSGRVIISPEFNKIFYKIFLSVDIVCKLTFELNSGITKNPKQNQVFTTDL